MMWNKGNGGRASRDGAQWFLRLVEPATTVQAWRLWSEGGPKYDGRNGSESAEIP